MKNANRATNGRWLPGHSEHGPGRPAKAIQEAFLLALEKVLPLKRWKKILERCAVDAENGDRHAREFLAMYVAGKPREQIAIVDATTEPAEPPKVVLLDWRKGIPKTTNGESSNDN
jgi:hypothetical protein